MNSLILYEYEANPLEHWSDQKQSREEVKVHYPRSISDRIHSARDFCQTMRCQLPVYCDNLDNSNAQLIAGFGALWLGVVCPFTKTILCKCGPAPYDFEVAAIGDFLRTTSKRT